MNQISLFSAPDQETEQKAVKESSLKFCPAGLCTRKISRSFPFCGAHWKLLCETSRMMVRDAMRVDMPEAEREVLLERALKEIHEKISLDG